MIVGPNGEKPRILNSWKEIAAYLGRGVRTVQRWEANLGLPVRRPNGHLRSAVIALPHEIDQWLLSTATSRPHSDGNPLEMDRIPRPVEEPAPDLKAS